MDYIDFGQQDGYQAHALFELPENIKFNELTTVSFQANENFIIAIGQKPISDVLLADKIPAGTKISRGYKNEDFSDIGAQYYNPGAIYLGFYCPADKITEYITHFNIAVNKVLRAEGINTFLVNNDIYMDDGTNKKKFSGSAWTILRDYATFGLTISLDVDNDTLDTMYDFTSEKFTKKGNITSTKNIVGGIKELKADADYQPLASNIMAEFAQRLGLTINNREATKEEKEAVNDLKKILGNYDWEYNGIHPFRK
jgi:hypothetical protein